MLRKIMTSISMITILLTCFFNSLQGAFDVIEATVDTIHEAMKRGDLTSTQLLELYLTRIKAANLDLTRGAPINAVVHLNISSYEEARQLDAFYEKHHDFVGPLHGIPIFLKDNIDSYDSPSTSGSLSLLGSQPIQDAYIVEKLRAAGAIIIGKSAMDEFANGINGISSRSGRIGNPYNPLYNAGGSSGGSAAAVNANFATLALGTDNSGSIRIPAAFNGLYGLRPSSGKVSSKGVFPRGNLDGIAGPIARSVKDLALLFAIISQADSLQSKNNPDLSFLQKNALQGKRIAIVDKVGDRDPFQETPLEIAAIYEQLYSNLKLQGAALIHLELPDFQSDRTENLAGEIEEINDYLQKFCSTRQSFNDICLSGRTQAFGGKEGCLKHAEVAGKISSDSYKKALQRFEDNRRYLQGLMTEQKIDAFLMPISREGIPTDKADAVITWQLPVASNSGFPSLAFIAGYSKEQLPVGMELIGSMNEENMLLAMAYALELVTPRRIVPNIPNTGDPFLLEMNLPQWNNLITTLGWHTYNIVLKDGEPTRLTADAFRKIVIQFLKSHAILLLDEVGPTVVNSQKVMAKSVLN